jgi:hypothetical protein
MSGNLWGTLVLLGIGSYTTCGDTTFHGDIIVGEDATFDLANLQGNVFINRWTTQSDLTLASGVRIGTLISTGIGNITIDLSDTQHAQMMSAYMTGNLTVIVASFGTINDIKLIISGSANTIQFNGVGTVSLNGDLITNDLFKDSTIIIDYNGNSVFNRQSVIVMLEVCAIPVDKDGIPIFRETNFTGDIKIAPSRMSDLRFSDDIPFVRMQSGSKTIEKLSNNLPISSIFAIEVVPTTQSTTIKTYRNTGNVGFPLNSDDAMIVAIDPSPATIAKYESYRVLAWPLNENGIPVIKVIP